MTRARVSSCLNWNVGVEFVFCREMLFNLTNAWQNLFRWFLSVYKPKWNRQSFQVNPPEVWRHFDVHKNSWKHFFNRLESSSVQKKVFSLQFRQWALIRFQKHSKKNYWSKKYCSEKLKWIRCFHSVKLFIVHAIEPYVLAFLHWDSACIVKLSFVKFMQIFLTTPSTTFVCILLSQTNFNLNEDFRLLLKLLR